MSSISCKNEIVARLLLNSASPGRVPLEIREGERLFVGADESSEIRLTDEGVASTHCVFSADGGVISVRDCYSESGTLVDGNRIREMQLTANAEIRVGAARISVQLDSGNLPTPPFTSPPHDTSEKRAPVSEQAEYEDHTIHEQQPESPFKTIEDLQLQLQQAHAEVEVLQNRLTQSVASVTTVETDPYQEEMIELLRAEVMDLQNALAERDLHSTDQSNAETEIPHGGDVTNQPDAERLDERLEQLLAELQLRDEQVATLTDLLETAEEASGAEREERNQMSAWLKDIEERFGSREQEWHIQLAKFEQSIEQLTNERDRAVSVMNADTSNAKLEATEKLMTSLRHAAESQRQQLQESEQTIAKLQSELKQVDHSQTREQLVQLAEQRAEVARQRQELDAARQSEARSAPNEATLKLQVLRQHLNEIHNQEQQEKEERKLSNRIAKLWGRMDGRS